MNKQEIIDTMNEELEVHTLWAEQGEIISNAINLDALIQPCDYTESKLHNWLKSRKNSLSAFSWYKELENVHLNLHYSYSDLFEHASRKYNPKTREELLKEFVTVETNLKHFNDKINEIKTEIFDMSDAVYLDYVLKSNAYNRQQKSTTNNSIESVADKSKTNSPAVFDTKELEDNQLETMQESSKLESASMLITTAALSTDTAVTKASSSSLDSNILTSKEVEGDAQIENDEMQRIDIVDYEEEKVVEKEDTRADLEKPIDPVEILDSESEADNTTVSETISDSENLISEFKINSNDIDPSDHLNKHIKLKLQNIKRLKTEKELTQQELAHLEETQKLSKQGISQLDQHLELKQQEIELEQFDNDKLLNTNIEIRKKIVEQLAKFQDKKEDLKNNIIDLEQENIKDELVLEELRTTPVIEKKFEALKQGKVDELSDLSNHLNDKNDELEKLKEQVLMLEKGIVDIEQDIHEKQQSMLDLEDKEKSKNNERIGQVGENESIIKQRNISIQSNNEDLDKLTIDEEATQKEHDELNHSFEKLITAIASLEKSNNSEIESIKSSQQEKQTILSAIDGQKDEKQEEINLIQHQIDEAEIALERLESELNESAKELELSS